ncbi:MAG: S8 family serine peptidase [Bacteroidales bacterium]|nr:S8 family serine peptidase [Bacteroidales bacterium]
MKIPIFYSLLITAMITIICSFTAQATPQGNNQRFALDRILVVTEAGMINADSLLNLSIAFSKIELLNPTKTIPDAKDILLIHLKNPGHKEIIRVIQTLSQNPIILSAERDYYHSENRVFNPRTPNDPRYGEQWHLPAIRAPQAWGITTGSRKVRVGIMDSGLDITHPDLVDNLWVNPNPNQTIGGFTFTNDIHGWYFNANRAEPPSSGTHGTHVAGIVGAVGNNGVGISGVCWEVSLVMLAIRGSSSQAVRALEYANFHNIQIAQNSWGGYGNPNRALYEAIRNYNGLFVISAGNSAGNLDIVGNSGMHYPLGFSLDGAGLHGFGPGLDNIISVMASNSTGGSSGNFGTNRVMIAAPGVSILSTYPMHQTAQGGYRTMTGSSMAAPVVSGVAALMMSARIENDLPQLSPQQIIRILMETARQVTTAANRNRAGGIVDAYDAVRMALTFCTECENVGCAKCPCEICNKIDCTDIHVTGITLPPTLNVTVGSTLQPSATVLPADATNRTISWSINNPALATIDSITGLITGLATGSTGITARTNDGNHVATSTLIVGTSNIADFEEIGTLRIYPNPVTDGRLFVEVTAQLEGETIRIHDLSGRLVLRQVAVRPRTEINISHLQAGVYIVTIGNVSIRIVKQ